MSPITGMSTKSDIAGENMKKLVIVTNTTKYRTLWEKAGGSGECPILLRNVYTNWDRVAENLDFWTSFAK
jgi:hypothetical protein